jgi:galactokinase
MWHFERSVNTTDAEQFLAALNGSGNFFSPETPLWVARAPGRLDLMGGIADYSGALVLEMPLEVATWVAVQFTTEPSITLLSAEIAELAGEPLVTIPLPLLQEAIQAQSYDAAHNLLTIDADSSWVAYVAGALVVLLHEWKLPLTQGIRLFIHSNVPPGKGVSSSAALEVATMRALCALYDRSIEGRELALLCQQAENLIVGAPCGVMDQMTSACGEQHNLLALLCQPAELQAPIALPEELEVWGIDSGIRHAVTGADYGSVRVGAFMGYRILADLAGLAVQSDADGRVMIADSCWQGYLANVPPSLWEMSYRDRIPLTIDGAAFLARYQGFTDKVTKIDSERVYAVRQPTAHPIYEHARVRLFRSLLSQPSVNEEQLLLLGELMYQSHASYSACGLGANGTDRLVELVRQAGPSMGLYGAKITGGGSGGTVAVLTRKDARKQVERIAALYTQETGRDILLLRGSSPGAVAWGSCQMRVQ